MNGFNYKKTMDEISVDIQKMEALSDQASKKALKKCGDVYKREVLTYATMSERFRNIADNAKSSVKKSKLGDGYYLVVKGGKGHASLWHLANNGYVAWGRVKIPGNHFVDSAEKAAEGDIEQIVDDALKEIVGGKV